MLHLILWHPEIPHNTGNIIRLCANAGATLHLIHPLGFAWDDKRLRRAGMDYREWARVQHHESLPAFFDVVLFNRLFALSKRGTHAYHDVAYQAGDAFLFGPESCGLPATLLETFPANHILRIPMQPPSRSLNLSNAAAIMLYEAWRQLQFDGAQ